MKLPGEIDDVAFNRRLIDRYDTVAFPGSFYGTPGTIRAGFGHEPELMSEGWQRLANAIIEWN